MSASNASDEPGTQIDQAEPQIEPVEGYNVRWQHGLLRSGPAPADRLVRLADVVRWLMHARELPFAAAVDEVCARIDGDSIMHMYTVDETGYARPMWEASAFDRFALSDEQLQGGMVGRAAHYVESMRASWLMTAWGLARLVNAPGAPVEYDSGLETPFEFLDRSATIPAICAIRIAKAHALWGWGTVAQAGQLVGAVVSVAAPAVALVEGDVSDWPSLVQYRRQFAGLDAQKRPDWKTHAAIVAARVASEYAQGRGEGAIGRLADEIGITRAGLGGVLKRYGYSPAGQKPATAWDGLLNRVAS